MTQSRTEKGTFAKVYREPRGKPIALRLPESIDKEARTIAGDNLIDFIKEAIAEKVAREKAQKTA